jgi:aldehyde dehydrogenase (NAD+)
MKEDKMANTTQFYIDGEWVDPLVKSTIDVIDPATEEPFTTLAVGSAADVNKAVAAAKRAFPSFSRSTRAERLTWLRALLEAYDARSEEIAVAVSREMGAPIGFSRRSQVAAGRAHLEAAIKALEDFVFFEDRGNTRVIKEAIGVAALITPWNWPLNQIATKVAPALAAGCTMVLKPSEIAPVSGLLFAEAVHAIGLPKGVFNLVNGDGLSVGQVMAGHPDVDVVSFTGSTRAGIIVAKTAADTVKRVSQELGGKSANIILPDADFSRAVSQGVHAVMRNSGQSCDAPTRMLVPLHRLAETLEIAKVAAEKFIVGNPWNDETTMGPVVSQAQFNKIQTLIQKGIDEGAALVTGGPGRPNGLSQGYYVRPTVFGKVTQSMTIAREEIFGPVLSIMTYKSVDEAVDIANDTVYGLAAYVQSGDLENALGVARRLRAGTVSVNNPSWNVFAPFGGYKQSGNGREYADFGIAEFLEIKGIVGFTPA